MSPLMFCNDNAHLLGQKASAKNKVGNRWYNTIRGKRNVCYKLPDWFRTRTCVVPHDTLTLSWRVTHYLWSHWLVLDMRSINYLSICTFSHNTIVWGKYCDLTKIYFWVFGCIICVGTPWTPKLDFRKCLNARSI